MSTTRSKFTVTVGVDGSEDAVKQLGDVEHAQKKAVQSAEASSFRWRDSFSEIGNNIKEVGKDLDNVGLAAGKTFAMTAEGALSVVTALGTGGLAGAVGVVTVAVGYAVQAWTDYNAEQAKAKKAVEEHKKAEEDRWKAALDGAKKAREEQAKKSSLDLQDIATARRSELVYLQATRERLKAQMILERIGSEERNKLAQEVKDTTVAITKAESELRLAERRAFVQKDKELTREANEALAEEGARAAAEAAKREEEIAKNNAEWLQWQLKLTTFTWDAMGKERDATDAAIAQNQADWLQWQVNNATQAWAAMGDAYAEYERNTLAWQEMELQARDLAEERRNAELELAAAISKRRDETAKAILVQGALNAETMSYGVVMSVVQPIVTDFTDALATLGTINRENYRDLVIFSNELPAIIAREVQARLGAMGAEATGKAIMSSADGLRETALGFGMLFINPADAAAHFTAAGVHFAAASAYGTLGTGALIGAGSIGALRGGGGPIALTQEERDTLDMRRGRDGSFSFGGDGGGDGGGGSIAGRQASGDGQFVVNVNQYSTISSADEQKGARAVAIVTRRALSNVFDRRRMRG